MTIFLKANARPPLEHACHRLIDNAEIGVRVIEKFVKRQIKPSSSFTAADAG